MEWHVPEGILTNPQFEKVVQTSSGWCSLRKINSYNSAASIMAPNCMSATSAYGRHQTPHALMSARDVRHSQVSHFIQDKNAFMNLLIILLRDTD